MTMMNQTLALILYLNFFVYQFHNKKACDIFAQNLELVKEGIEKKPGVNLMEVGSAISFLEEVTLIKSESDINYAGKYLPTQNDYDQWKIWYKKNKSKLYWDDQHNKVSVRGPSR